MMTLRSMAIAATVTLSLVLVLAGFSKADAWKAEPQTDRQHLLRASDTLNTLTAAEQQAGWHLLFDGETLDGWHRHMNLPGDQVGGQWDVQDGAIVGDQHPPGHGGFLVTDDVYRDFVLTLETKLDYPVDSGLFLRVGDTGASHQITLDYRPDGYIGAVYMAYLNGMVYENPSGIEHFKKGAWNTVKVRIEGNPAHVQFWLNGRLVTDFQHTEATTEGAPQEGTIGLQVHPGESYEAGNKVRFRNIQVKPLATN